MNKGSIAEQAYNATKTEGDPDFANTPQEYRNDLEFRAEGVMRTGLTINNFEEKVKELHQKESAAVEIPLGTKNGLGEAAKSAASGTTAESDDKDSDSDKIEESAETLSGKSRDELDAIAVEEKLAGSVEESKEKFANMTLLRDAIEEARAK